MVFRLLTLAICTLKFYVKHHPAHADSAHLEMVLQEGSRGIFLIRGPKQRGTHGDVQESFADDKSSPGDHLLSGLNGKVRSAHLLMDGLCFSWALIPHRLTVYFPKYLGDHNTEAVFLL